MRSKFVWPLILSLVVFHSVVFCVVIATFWRGAMKVKQSVAPMALSQTNLKPLV